MVSTGDLVSTYESPDNYHFGVGVGAGALWSEILIKSIMKYLVIFIIGGEGGGLVQHSILTRGAL